eukprot:scaffold239993_cov31-Prasinocladus_malaysianus.AAC.1
MAFDNKASKGKLFSPRSLNGLVLWLLLQSEQLLEECSVYQEAIKAGQLAYVAYACIHRNKHAAAVEAAKQAIHKASEAMTNLE